MCRFLAYRRAPILMETLVATPCRSLIHQSLHACESKVETNGDGFGLGWYGERPEPGLYREVRPAWSDENLRSIAAQVRSRLFLPMSAPRPAPPPPAPTATPTRMAGSCSCTTARSAAGGRHGGGSRR